MRQDMRDLRLCSHCSNLDDNHCGGLKGGHAGLCCDCFDLSYGMSLAKLNVERERKGRPPIQREWPISPNTEPLPLSQTPQDRAGDEA